MSTTTQIYNNIEERDGKTYLYFPLQTLQKMNILYQISKYNKQNNNAGNFTYDSDNNLYTSEWAPVYETDFIPIESWEIFSFLSDLAGWRIYYSGYDENKNLLENPSNIKSPGAVAIQDPDYNFGTTVNTTSHHIVWMPGTAKYIKIKITSGGSIKTKPFSFLSIYLRNLMTKVTVIDNIRQKLYDTRTSVPTTGYWEQGQKVYNRTPSIGGNVGWVCIESGTPGIWAPFGIIENSSI